MKGRTVEREDRLEGRTVWKGGPFGGKERERQEEGAESGEAAAVGMQGAAAAVALQKGVQAGPRWAVPQEAQQCR